MRKLWWLVGVVVLAVAGTATAWAVRAKMAEANKPKPAETALEFTPTEVTRPVLADRKSVV